jgi:predicted RNA polymerase sigma factor
VKAATPRDHVGDESAPTPRAELLRDLGRNDEARAADQSALELTANPAEQSLLRQRISWT